jgi:hypothetical protein
LFHEFQGRAPSDYLFQLNEMVPIGPDHSLAQRLADLGNIAVCSKELSSEEVVGELFPEPHSEKHLHIVVQCPGEYSWLIVPYEMVSLKSHLTCAFLFQSSSRSYLNSILICLHVSAVNEPSLLLERQLLELNCLVLGDGPGHVFPVTIEQNKLVGTLREAIKDKKKRAFLHVDADNLVLWKVSILVNGSLEHALSNFDDTRETPLSPVDELSEVFPEPPTRRHVHIIVKSPPVGKCE